MVAPRPTLERVAVAGVCVLILRACELSGSDGCGHSMKHFMAELLPESLDDRGDTMGSLSCSPHLNHLY